MVTFAIGYLIFLAISAVAFLILVYNAPVMEDEDMVEQNLYVQSDYGIERKKKLV